MVSIRKLELSIIVTKHKPKNNQKTNKNKTETQKNKKIKTTKNKKRNLDKSHIVLNTFSKGFSQVSFYSSNGKIAISSFLSLVTLSRLKLCAHKHAHMHMYNHVIRRYKRYWLSINCFTLADVLVKNAVTQWTLLTQ